MSNKGTSETEQSLNVLKSEEELADAILDAVSDDNGEEMLRLFSAEVTPDALPDDDEDSNKDSEQLQEDTSDKEPDDQTATTSGEGDRTTAQTLTPAEERLAKLEQQLNDAKAAVGRTAALQSRLAQLENQLRKSQQQKKEPVVDPADKELDDRIARLKEIDPDTAAILEDIKKRQVKAVPEETPDQEDNDAQLREEYYKVLEVHADAGEIFKHPYWHMWKQQLSPDQRSWAESSDSQKVAVALTEYKKFLQGAPGTAVQQQPVAQGVEVVQEDVVDATKLAREKKLQRSADSSDTPVKKSPQFDAEALFQEAYAQAAKDAGITY